MQDNNSANSPILKDTSSVDEAVPEATNNQTEPIEPTSSNKRIAKNALMLYVRLFLTMIVGLYTSRVVLNTLGVEDYGIYGVVGGVVSMLGFLNASMSGATSRFLTFELGRGDKQRLKDTFSSALIVHIGIALVVFVLAETVGLWFLTHKLVIPEGRMTAAHWVYQCSILSAMLGITQAPYNATIIAHEKMDVYAYVEILNVTLKLLIVYLLVIGNFDKLILYALLVLAVSVFIMMVYRIYCIRHFSESHFHWIWNPAILKPLLSFSGWDLYGNGCVVARQQGTNFLINMFFGVVYNAAGGIASMVAGLIKGLVSNVIQAFRPVIIKCYALDDVSSTQKNMANALKYMLLLFGCVFVPIYLEMPYLFELWLLNVPEGAVVFCRMLLIASIFSMISNVFTILIHATGRIKTLSFVSGSFYLLALPAIYLIFRQRNYVYDAYNVMIGINILILISNIMISKYLVPRISIAILLKSLVTSFLIISISSIPAILLYYVLDDSPIRVMVISLIHVLFMAIGFYFFVLDSYSRERLKKKVWHLFP